MKKTLSHGLKYLAVPFATVCFALLVISLSCFAGDFVDIRSKSDIPADLSGKTVIVQTNDIHGKMGSYSKSASLKQELKDRGAEVILLDLGDYSVGSQDVSSSNGRNAIQAMNSSGYDLATIGNHEFDYGLTELKNNLSAARFTNICANIFCDNGAGLLQPNTIISSSGLKIGFFGLCTPKTPLDLESSFTQGLKFLSGQELYSCAQEQTDLLKSQGADLVICLSHLGQDRNAEPLNSSSIDVYANTSGIDLILDSHSHTAITSGPEKEPIQAAGVHYEYIGIVIIGNASGRIEDRFLVTTDDAPKQDAPDKAVTEPAEQSIQIPVTTLQETPLQDAMANKPAPIIIASNYVAP